MAVSYQFSWQWPVLCQIYWETVHPLPRRVGKASSGPEVSPYSVLPQQPQIVLFLQSQRLVLCSQISVCSFSWPFCFDWKGHKVTTQYWLARSKDRRDMGPSPSRSSFFPSCVMAYDEHNQYLDSPIWLKLMMIEMIFQEIDAMVRSRSRAGNKINGQQANQQLPKNFWKRKKRKEWFVDCLVRSLHTEQYK